jgi:hypothetical protein
MQYKNLERATIESKKKWTGRKLEIINSISKMKNAD